MLVSNDPVLQEPRGLQLEAGARDPGTPGDGPNHNGAQAGHTVHSQVQGRDVSTSLSMSLSLSLSVFLQNSIDLMIYQTISPSF